MRFVFTVVIFSILSISAHGQSIKAHITKLLESAPSPGAAGLKKKMPGKVVDAQLAYYGVYALLKFEDSKRIGVFNIAQGKFQKILPMKSNNFLYTAGSDMLLVYYPDFKVIELWNLTTLTKIKAKKVNLDKGFLTDIVMGAATKSKAFVSGADAGGDLSRRFYGIMDLNTFAVKEFPRSNVFRNSSLRDFIHIRPNNSLTKVLMWCTSHSPTGYTYASFASGEAKGKYEHSSYGSLNFSNDEDKVLTTSGLLVNRDGQKLKEMRGFMFFPVLGGDFYVQATSSSSSMRSSSGSKNIIQVRDLNTHGVIMEYNSPVSLTRSGWSKASQLVDDRQLLAAKVPDRMMVIDNKNLFAHIYMLGVKGKGGVGLPPHASIGAPWKFKLDYPPGTKILIEDGPQGMVLDSSSLTLNWPSPNKKGVIEVLLSITKPAEDEIYKEIKVFVK